MDRLGIRHARRPFVENPNKANHFLAEFDSMQEAADTGPRRGRESSQPPGSVGQFLVRGEKTISGGTTSEPADQAQAVTDVE